MPDTPTHPEPDADVPPTPVEARQAYEALLGSYQRTATVLEKALADGNEELAGEMTGLLLLKAQWLAQLAQHLPEGYNPPPLPVVRELPRARAKAKPRAPKPKLAKPTPAADPNQGGFTWPE